jgi:HPt (histidine-containing phosphotransfer) domain-containing protein
MAGSPFEPLVSVFENDPEIGEIVAMFVAEMPERQRELRRAAEAGDLREAMRIAHQIKGAAGGYGLEALGHMAAASERALGALLEARNPQVSAVLAAAEPLLEACGRVRLSSSEAAA